MIINDFATGSITTVNNLGDYDVDVYLQILVDSIVIERTVDFNMKNTMNFCTANHDITCYEADSTDPSGGTIYTKCYECNTV